MSNHKFKFGDELRLADNAKVDYIQRWRAEDRREPWTKDTRFTVSDVHGNGNITVRYATGPDTTGIETWEGTAFVPAKRRPTIASDLKLKPQAKTVLTHLRRYDHISPMQALVVHNISRLAAVIYDIREAGYEVDMKLKEDAQGHKYAQYALVA